MTHLLLTPLNVGNQTIANRLIVAPMAGVTDNPFRRLCKSFGAGYAISEMMTADKALYAHKKSLFRADFTGEIDPICAQIAGGDVKKLCEAARFQVDNGAKIVDINMGCPAKKVYRKLAGSALLLDLDLVEKILNAVVAAVDVPVTLKTRLGVYDGQENILTVANLAQNAGIAALTIHGRTKEQMYTGTARYELIKEVKANAKIPIIVNGDIDSPQKAKWVQEYTNADAVMIGRSAQGKPWIFREIRHYLQTGQPLPAPSLDELRLVVLSHLDELYRFYGEYSGVRIARKHIAWYTGGLPSSNAFREAMYACQSSSEQYRAVDDFLKAFE
ncbi:tRNA dihydrouridine synthase DusB [Moraxella oblonga]|uniref:tRNA dihydrouridine synthase DusB n=1 Tax=Moraxella oblonga TaxID=200413 RepID=UPI00082E1C74|nr:tRNA dihydrouridine synthase DusB [Moraxella oblonga]